MMVVFVRLVLGGLMQIHIDKSSREAFSFQGVLPMADGCRLSFPWALVQVI